jgi:hypothetical protein
VIFPQGASANQLPQGLSPEQIRYAIAMLLANGSPLGSPAPADTGTPYQDIVDPSDPASYNSSIIDALDNFGPPTVTLNPGDLIDPGDLSSPPPSALEAPAPQQQMEGLPEPDPGDPDSRGTLEAPSPSQQVVDALETQSQIADDQANTAPAVNDTFGGLAIANDITGSLADMNAAVNDAVAGYTSDPGSFGAPASGNLGDPGGFGGFGAPASGNLGDPGGFTSDPGGFTSDPGGFDAGPAGFDAGGPGTGDGAGGGGAGGGAGK